MAWEGAVGRGSWRRRVRGRRGLRWHGPAVGRGLGGAGGRGRKGLVAAQGPGPKWPAMVRRLWSEGAWSREGVVGRGLGGAGGAAEAARGGAGAGVEVACDGAEPAVGRGLGGVGGRGREVARDGAGPGSERSATVRGRGRNVASVAWEGAVGRFRGRVQ
ncbi:hypothetical protein GCM10010508_54940 [Streptomyces naganishii JCM 4654]|uniref:Uncharacterized protein n=1 Tax=Streptomyces naganishii JCM 4654 TaxID=1306179 RepID=A0A918Y8A3_9ACTN|nr:hypothetical protein GCM10010508_54940 [Streptomyces naganishii JCM 4654]